MEEHAADYSDEAMEYAQSLVDAGEYPSIAAAVSAALLHLKTVREQEYEAVAQEILRRDRAPAEEWVEWKPGEILKRYRERRARDL